MHLVLFPLAFLQIVNIEGRFLEINSVKGLEKGTGLTCATTLYLFCQSFFVWREHCHATASPTATPAVLARAS